MRTAQRTAIATFILAMGLFSAVSQANNSIPEIETAIMNTDYETSRGLAVKALKDKALSKKDHEQAQYYLGLSYLRLKQFTEAISSFQLVMAATNSKELYDTASLGMIEALYMAGFYTDSLRNTEELLRRSSKSAYLSLIYLKKARVHMKLTQWGKAKESLMKIINDFPQSLEAPIAQSLMEEKEFFSVQVGSFIDNIKAQALLEKLKGDGYYAFIVETTSPDQRKFFRVRVGQTTSLSDAQSMETKLAQLGYPTLIYP